MTIHRRRRSAVWPYWATIAVVLLIAALGLAFGLVEFSLP